MDLDRRKIVAAQKLLATDQEKVIEQVEQLFSAREQVEITDDQKRLLDEALYSLEEDGRRLHEDVVRDTNERYNKK